MRAAHLAFVIPQTEAAVGANTHTAVSLATQFNYTAAFVQYKGGIEGVTPSGQHAYQCYYCGIIDMLQTYDVQKQMEHTAKVTSTICFFLLYFILFPIIPQVIKAVGKNASGISAVESEKYAARFMNFVTGYLLADDEVPHSPSNASMDVLHEENRFTDVSQTRSSGGSSGISARSSEPLAPPPAVEEAEEEKAAEAVEEEVAEVDGGSTPPAPPAPVAE